MRVAANPWIGITFIHDNTRMEVPPAYFLQRLHDFDSDIVVVPSRQRPFAYVIARRKRRSKGITDAAIESTISQPDTLMCFKYGLVPVCLMFKTGTSWNSDTIIKKLKARDIWAHGGPNAVADMLEAQEAGEETARKAALRDDMWHRSGDAYRSYQARTGQRVGGTAMHVDPSRLGAATSPTAPSSSTTGRVTLT